MKAPRQYGAAEADALRDGVAGGENEPDVEREGE
jgi:hypothetical protein